MVFGKKFTRQDVKEQPVEEEFEEELNVPVPQPVKRTVSQSRYQTEDISNLESDWEVKEVPTQTQPVIYNKRTKKYLGLYEAIAEILNRSEE